MRSFGCVTGGCAKSVWWLLTVVVAIGGCATPAQRMDSQARRFGFTVGVAESSGFKLRIYRNRYAASGAGSTLHVYLEGDGTPWVNHVFVARDPTPRSPVVLRLMALDRKPSLYLGRPCYGGYANVPPCRPDLWTDGRYSERVVDSMARALRGYLRNEGVDTLELFGYSGGGVLAMLLAERFPQTRVVVTLGANLDTQAWARLHGYTPLRESLNPASRPALTATIRQLHLVGARDNNVPPSLLSAIESRQPNAQVIVVSDFDHACCWERIWPQVLDWVSKTGPIGALSGQ